MSVWIGLINDKIHSIQQERNRKIEFRIVIAVCARFSCIKRTFNNKIWLKTHIPTTKIISDSDYVDKCIGFAS